jgi:hypothetical protein
MTYALDVSRVSKVRDTIKTLIDSHFASTLGREIDVVNIVSALVQKESSFNVNSTGKLVSATPGSLGYKYLRSSAISAKYATANPTETANLDKGRVAIGLMQIMGWNIIKGGSPDGVCEVQRIRPDLAGSLVINPGEDPFAVMLGESNMSNAILAGLVVLDGKYKAVYETPAGYSVKGDKYKRNFYSKISAAVAAYVGLGKADLNGTTPEAYSNSIVGGDAYAVANGKGSIKIYDSKITIASSNGPSTNGSSQSRVGSAGCTPPKQA